MYLPGFEFGMAYAGLVATADATSFSGILQMATELLAWAVTSMGEIVDFITSHPIMTVFLVFTIVGFACGFLFRIWHSVS